MSESFFTWPVRSSIPLVETEIQCVILSIQHRVPAESDRYYEIVISTIAHEYEVENMLSTPESDRYYEIVISTIAHEYEVEIC